jgi:hypothetical protein
VRHARAPAIIAQAEFTDFRRNFRWRIGEANGAQQCCDWLHSVRAKMRTTYRSAISIKSIFTLAGQCVASRLFSPASPTASPESGS